MYTHTKFVSRKMFLQKLNQGPLADTGGTTNNYGAASACHGGVGVTYNTMQKRAGSGLILDLKKNSKGNKMKMTAVGTPHHTNMLA